MSDPRGPERKILSKKLNLDSTVLTLSCGHKVKKNAIYTYNVGEMSHCIPCLEEEEEAPEKEEQAIIEDQARFHQSFHVGDEI